MTGYDYGNARLRARKSRFLGRSDYEALLSASDLEALLGLLGGTRYGPDIEAVLPRLRSIRRCTVDHVATAKAFSETV